MDVHFLLRYSDKITQVDTLQEHMNILDNAGRVIFGKFGIGISRKMVDMANSQIEKGVCTRLYLYRGKDCVGVFKLQSVRDKLKKNDGKYVPLYYRGSLCSAWFYIESAISFDDGALSELRLFNNPMLKPQLSGMRSLIYVTTACKFSDSKNDNVKMEEGSPIVDADSLYFGGLFD
ncbi:hypothetical protein [Aeromonas veronii]|uniref:hypothetical protein n=1 Tax=Aeromonas veronii TaxID=654 RepID=UPI003D25CC47